MVAPDELRLLREADTVQAQDAAPGRLQNTRRTRQTRPEVYAVTLPRQHAGFDERRNSSRVWPVPPNALPDARRALDLFRRDYPELVTWIEEGAPRLTAAEHYARFGEDYGGGRGKRA
jgi:hypothetical protein